HRAKLLRHRLQELVIFLVAELAVPAHSAPLAAGLFVTRRHADWNHQWRNDSLSVDALDRQASPVSAYGGASADEARLVRAAAANVRSARPGPHSRTQGDP